MVGFESDSDEELNFPEEEEEPKMVDQMQLLKRKTLPERQPPIAKVGSSSTFFFRMAVFVLCFRREETRDVAIGNFFR